METSQGGFIVRTMKDDMEGVKNIPSVPVPPPPPVPKKPEPQPVTEKKPDKKQEKTIIPAPMPTVHRKRTAIVMTASFSLLVAVMVGGWWAYQWFMSSGSLVQQAEQGNVTFEQVVPKSALLITDYNLENESNAKAVEHLWETKGAATSPLGGDPRSILPSMVGEHTYYVLLQDNTSPFLIVKKNENSSLFVSQQTGVQVLEKNGWYILHSSDTASYAAALEKGNVSSRKDKVIAQGPYVIRYIMSSEFVSQVFDGMAADLIGLSTLPALTFEVSTVPENSMITARAVLPGNASQNQLSYQTQELLSLIPGSVDFVKGGLRFVDDVASWQSAGGNLNAAVLNQPAVRQFLATLTQPYVVFKRTGVDGIRDIGAIVQLPDSLRKNLRLGDASLEQSLPAMIPLIVGKALGLRVAFTETTYQGNPLRYININGQTQTLDYSVGDNFILISSSREGMRSLVDRMQGKEEGIVDTPAWKSLVANVGESLAGKEFFLGRIKDQSIIGMIPVSSNTQDVPLSVVIESVSTGTQLNLVIGIP